MSRPKANRNLTHQVCRVCHQDLPINRFARYPTGTYRTLCRTCKYRIYDIAAKERYTIAQAERDRYL